MLNTETNKYGINFPVKESQFGKTVNMLDVTLYLDENNTIQYKSYNKPTNSKRYLNTRSFHAPHTFRSVPFSQMLRTLNRNSNVLDQSKELDTLQENLVNSGYKKENLLAIRTDAINRLSTPPMEKDNSEPLVFSVYNFECVQELKNLINSLRSDIQVLTGDNRLIVAIKKCKTLGNVLVKNRCLSVMETANSNNQKCNSANCLQCPLVDTNSGVEVNGKAIRISQRLNCSSRNVIYLWQCKLCKNDNSYFGRTTQKCNKRTSGHRSCFNQEKWEKSALSMHAMEYHSLTPELHNFKVSIVSQVSPQRIRREEFKWVEKFRTNCLGLNRYKVLN